MSADEQYNPYAVSTAVSPPRTLRNDWKELPGALAFPAFMILLTVVIFAVAIGSHFVEEVAAGDGVDLERFTLTFGLGAAVASVGVLVAYGLIRRSRWAHFFASLFFFVGGLLTLGTSSPVMGLIFGGCFYALLSKRVGRPSDMAYGSPEAGLSFVRWPLG